MMTKIIFACCIFFFLSNFKIDCAQPYFPPQITFTTKESADRFLFAADEINQQAYEWHLIDSDDQLHAYAMEHFPYATPDSPESKNYVQLSVYEPIYCVYTAIWKYGSGMHDIFPEHWYDDGSTFRIGNYMQFGSKMIYDTNSSIDEDHWYSEETCTVKTEDVYPCQEIFFKKDTDIPLRYIFVEGSEWYYAIRVTENYEIISIGKPDEKLFKKIPKDWMNNCTDLNLGLDFILPSPIIQLNESVTVKIRLTSPPHRVNGSDTMLLEWRNDETSSQCRNCLKWEPKQFSFNIDNFHQYQTMTVTRVKNGLQTTIRPVMNGGGYDKIRSDDYSLLFR